MFMLDDKCIGKIVKKANSPMREFKFEEKLPLFSLNKKCMT
jgi:hypothetical protein